MIDSDSDSWLVMTPGDSDSYSAHLIGAMDFRCIYYLYYLNALISAHLGKIHMPDSESAY